MIDQIRQQRRQSVRRNCRVLGFRRQTYHHRRLGFRFEERDWELQDLLERTAQRFLAWGFWMIFYYLRNQGHVINHKRVYRIWTASGLHLRLPPKRARIRREYRELLPPDGINEGWAMDFVSDWVVGPQQQPVRIINVMDEGSRKALWTEAYPSISARKLIEVLDQLLGVRGCPAYIWCDNGPEFISHQLRQWAADHAIELKHIQPGKPSQNGLIERLNKTLRVECLNECWFASLDELNDQLQQWSLTYNYDRPHRSLGYQSPESYEIANENFYFRVVAA
ncbi:IS3 family transposase [Lewinella sp. IMCC34183]|uniref:IS3 family transposase n=1 Tax=Lewinella sp. IMCC34183 TaxID=2248762 RepID=UPI000E21D69E|nr:IS3 family transposase [Lewinella sp. IMCC34183]